MKLYSIRDRKVNYNTPFEAKNDTVARRSFDATRKAENSMIGMYPEDYELWLIGYFDEEKGTINQLGTYEPKLIMRGDEEL